MLVIHDKLEQEGGAAGFADLKKAAKEKKEEMNEEVVEEEQLDEYGYEQEAEDYKNRGPRKQAEPYTPPEEKSAYEKMQDRKKARAQRIKRAMPGLQETLKRLANAKKIVIKK